MKKPFPWFSDTRSGGGWFVKLNGDQNFLGKHPEDAPPPKKGKDGRWNPPQGILDEFYNLTALRDTASKSNYTICARFLEELEETPARPEGHPVRRTFAPGAFHRTLGGEALFSTPTTQGQRWRRKPL